MPLAGSGPIRPSALSADGGAVAFLSRATDLVTGQTGDSQWENAYLYDRLTGRAELASRSLASADYLIGSQPLGGER